MLSVTHLAKDIAAKLWPLLAARVQQGWRWLAEQRDPLTWTVLRDRLTTLPLLPSSFAGRFAVLVGIIVLLLLVLPWYAKGHKDKNGVVTYPNATLINPILAGTGAALLIYAAIRQAQTASNRHKAQTEADHQRRIIESFSKAIEQLGSDKLEVRLGGIYALERISQESPRDYWTVMETLTAFVRERAKGRPTAATEWAGKSDYLWGADKGSDQAQPAHTLATDITAILEVIRRRPEAGRNREKQHRWRFDLKGADLRGANLVGTHLQSALLFGAQLEGANLEGAHLERAFLVTAHLEDARLVEAHLEYANLYAAHLEGAFLFGAHLKGANLEEAHLKGAYFPSAHLEGASLERAHLEGASLERAHLEGATLWVAHLEGANLRHAKGLTQSDIDACDGDAATKLPERLTRPSHWAGQCEDDEDDEDKDDGLAPAP